MSAPKGWWDECRDWYARLSPGGRWACSIGLALLAVVLIRAGRPSPSGSHGIDPAVGGQPYGAYPVAPVGYGPPPVAHPGEFRGRISSGTIDTSGLFFVPKRDALAMRTGTVFRLIELYNIQILGKKTNLITAQYHSEEVIQDTPKIQWVTDLKTKLKVLEPGSLYNEDGSVSRKSLVTTKGLVEESFRHLNLGQIIQFIRYGFCRVDSRDTCVLAHK